VALHHGHGAIIILESIDSDDVGMQAKTSATNRAIMRRTNYRNLKEGNMSIKTVGIIGAGTMGNGIAQACAVAGIDAVMLDINDAAVQKGLATMSGSLDRLVKKEKMTAEQKAAAMARVKATTQVADMQAVDIVIEAATENEGELFEGAHEEDTGEGRKSCNSTEPRFL
jgi:threonine dehydrogenase-like Zn-dependent dehydrogenase